MKVKIDVATVITGLTESFIHPVIEQNLVSLSTGIEVPNSFCRETLDTKELGRETMNTFIKELIGAASVKSFFDPMKVNFHMNKTKTLETKNKVVSLKTSKDLVARFVIIAQKRYQ
jgi:hypothetical protein